MNGDLLLDELGRKLGFNLKFSDNGCCGVFFDEDEVLFEQHDKQFYIIADIGSSVNREAISTRLLAANYLGQESGQAVLSLDVQREIFTLHRVLVGEISYSEFEEILATFVQALRYWKEWLSFSGQNNDSITSNSAQNKVSFQGLLV